MKLFAPFQEILKVIIVIWPIFESKILPEGFSHVVNLTVLTFILFQWSSINDGELLELGNWAKSHMGITHKFIERIMFDVQVFNVFEIRQLINDNCISNLAALNW